MVKSGNWKMRISVSLFKKGIKEDPRTFQPLCMGRSWIRSAPLRSCAKAHGGQGGDSRQPAWLHQGQVQPDQPSGLLWWSKYMNGHRKGYRGHLSISVLMEVGPSSVPRGLYWDQCYLISSFMPQTKASWACSANLQMTLSWVEACQDVIHRDITCSITGPMRIS